MSKRYITSRRMSILSWVIAGLILGSGTAGATSNILAVWANDGGSKVTRDELRAGTDATGVLNSVWDGTTVKSFGARNEVVGFNLVLEAPTAPARSVSVSFDTVIGPEGDVISSTPVSGDGVFNWVNRNIELFYVRYLEIKGLSRLSYESYDERHIPRRLRRPWTGEGYGSGTWFDRPDHNKFYPDIAIPLELVPAFDIAAGQNQSIWVDIYIPNTAKPGLYLGAVTVRESGVVTHEIPVELQVRTFTLPELPNARTMVYLGYEDINLRYLGNSYPDPGTQADADSRLIRDRHVLLAHRHRLSMIDENCGGWSADRPCPEWLPRLDGSLFTAANGYDGPGVNTGNNVFSIGTYGSWSWQGGGEAAMRLHADAWVNWFDANAPDAEYFLYLIDESDNYAQIEQWARWIHNNPGQGHRLMSLATIPLPVAAANTPSLDIAASSLGVGITTEWQNAADDYGANPDKRFFLYNGGRPASGSFATDDDGVALWELAWGQYKKKIDRWFYWESTYYNNFQGGMGQTNVFRNAQTFGSHDRFDPVIGETGWNYTNGDGVLFYPGTDLRYPDDSYGVKGPFASLRMKQWRRGIQDVDYLTMAAAIDPVRVQEIVDAMVPLALWEYGVSDPSDPTWVRADISWSTDPDAWAAARAELANIIEGGPSLSAADLALTASGAPDSVTVGSSLTYTVTVTNLGPDAAAGATLADTLPAGATLVSATPTQGSCSGTTRLTCGLGSLANGASAAVMIVVRPTAAGTITNRASVTGAGTDPDRANNTATTVTTVSRAFPLTISVKGTGTVESSPAQVLCPPACSASFAEGMAVTLTPKPAVGWHFAGWGGACRGTGACVVNMTAKRSVKATFKRDQR